MVDNASLFKVFDKEGYIAHSRIMLSIINSPETTRQTRAYIIFLVREHQFKFTGNYIRMLTDKPANQFFIYESKIRLPLRLDALRMVYLNQISSHVLPGEKTLEANEIRKIAANKEANLLSCQEKVHGPIFSVRMMMILRYRRNSLRRNVAFHTCTSLISRVHA